MSPLTLTRDGKSVLARTAIGSGLHRRNVQVLAKVLESSMDVQAAAQAPTFGLPEWTGAKPVARGAAGEFDKAVLDGVRGLGKRSRSRRRRSGG